MPFLFDLAPFAYSCFPCRCLYVSTRSCRGDLRGAVRHRARGYRAFCFDYLSRQGGELVPLLYNFLLLPSCSLRTYCLILSTLYAMFKTHTAMSPQPSKTLYCWRNGAQPLLSMDRKLAAYPLYLWLGYHDK